MALVFIMLLAGPAACAAEESGDAAVEAVFHNRNGHEVGVIVGQQTPNGVLFDITIDGLPAGEHAFHIHNVGVCDPPFHSAGGHFSPEDKEHGILDEDGKHAGDLPNIHLPDAGTYRFEILAQRVTLRDGMANSLIDDDGSSFIIHSGPDDYHTDPQGDAGSRIACAVIKRRSTPQ